MCLVDRNFTTNDGSIVTEFLVKISVSPLHRLETFNENRGTLDVFNSVLSSNCMSVVRKNSTDLISFDLGVLVLGTCFLGCFNSFKHHKSEVEILEERSSENMLIKLNLPSDADLTRPNVLLKVVADVHVGGAPRKIRDVNHSVSVL